MRNPAGDISVSNNEYISCFVGLFTFSLSRHCCHFLRSTLHFHTKPATFIDFFSKLNPCKIQNQQQLRPRQPPSLTVQPASRPDLPKHNPSNSILHILILNSNHHRQQAVHPSVPLCSIHPSSNPVSQSSVCLSVCPQVCAIRSVVISCPCVAPFQLIAYCQG